MGLIPGLGEIADPDLWSVSDRIPAHRIEAPGGPVTVPGQDYQSQGYSLLDESMRKEQADLLSESGAGFAPNYAHPDLICPGYLSGKETVTLENLTPDGFFRFDLPGYAMLGLVRYHEGMILPVRLFLDTLHLDSNNMVAELIWRCCVDASCSIRVCEFRMEQLRGRRLMEL